MGKQTETPPAAPAQPVLLGAAPADGAPSFAMVAPRVFRLAGLRPAEAEPFWDAACEIADDLVRKHGVKGVAGFDPMTIMAIISILLEAIKFYKECRQKPAQMIADAKENGRLFSGARLRRWKLQRIVEAKIEDEQILVEELNNKPAEAILAYAARQSEATVEKLFAAA